MANRTCSIEGCGRKHKARGWCKPHWKRWSKSGDPGAGTPVGEVRRTPGEAFSARLERRGDCLVWTGALNQFGYARPRIGGVKVYAHRWAWEQERGPIPSGMDVDHVCHNRACVNTGHLRLATRAQNAANRSGANAESQTGLRNVRKHGSGYQACVYSQGAQHRSTVFPTMEEAAEAAQKLRAELFGEFAGRG